MSNYAITKGRKGTFMTSIGAYNVQNGAFNYYCCVHIRFQIAAPHAQMQVHPLGIYTMHGYI